MGGGGLAQPHQEVSPEADMKGVGTTTTIIPIMVEDDILPEYSEIAPHDEGIDMQEDGDDVPMYGPPGLGEEQPAWSFSHLGSVGAPHPQMTAVPPSSLDGEGSNDFYTQEEDLFAADDNASTQAEGGDRSSVEMSDPDENFVDTPLLGASAERRGFRESAPPPPTLGGEAGDDLPVAEIRVDDADEEIRG